MTRCGPTVVSAFMPASDCTVTRLAMSSSWSSEGRATTGPRISMAMGGIVARAYNLDTSFLAVPKAGHSEDLTLSYLAREKVLRASASADVRPEPGGASVSACHPFDDTNLTSPSPSGSIAPICDS